MKVPSKTSHKCIHNVQVLQYSVAGIMNESLPGYTVGWPLASVPSGLTPPRPSCYCLDLLDQSQDL